MLSGPSHLQCPVCRHAFMSIQSRADATEACPHCAFAGPRPHFRTLTGSLAAEPVRFQKRTPRMAEPPADHQTAQAAPPAAVQPQFVQTQPPVHHPALMHRTPPAVWPGAGIETSAAPMAAAPASEDVLIEPKKERPVFFWITVTILTVAVCLFTGLLAWEKIQQRVQRLRAERAARTQVAATNSNRLLVPSARVDPMEELNARVQTGAAMSEMDRLIKMLFNSSTPDERLKAIASPREFQKEVAALFDDNPKKPALVALTPITNPPLSLATRERLPMFKVVTTGNRVGALVRTVPDGTGGQAIDWPLFHETHEGQLARHIEEKSREPRWFHVGLRRTHSFDVPKEISNEFDAIDIDGSTDGSGRVVTYVAKESPLGRHFARHLEWSKFYFGRVLVSWMDIAGETRPALLDCEGSMLPDETKPDGSK